MKKSVIIVTAIVYLLSIVVVAFLGFVAEIHNPPIYAEDIVMVLDEADQKDFPNWPEEPYTYYANGAPLYDVTYNPEANIESENIEERYKYTFKFRGKDEAEFFYNYINEISLNMMPYSSQGECETLKLDYTIDKDRQQFVEVSKEGIVTYKVFAKASHETIVVSTKDGTNIRIYINIVW